MNTITKLSASVLVLCIFSAQAARAQEATSGEAPLPVSVEVVAETTHTSSAKAEEEAAVMPAESVGLSSEAEVQSTAETQEAVTTEALEETADPTDTVTEDTETIPVADATTTDEVIEPVIEVVPELQESAVEIPLPPAEELTLVAETLAPTVETVATQGVPLNKLSEMLEPDYVFALSGELLPTKIAVGNTVETLNATVDVQDGTVDISGTCSDVYYVVLLYKNQTDYDDDPASYILNRAYPCENGAYSYSIDDLPTTVENGTYYLLVGEQGNRGSWKPVTPLRALTINRSN